MEQEPATLAKQIGTEGTNETLKFTMFQWLAGPTVRIDSGM